jgi:hypothetical protein
LRAAAAGLLAAVESTADDRVAAAYCLMRPGQDRMLVRPSMDVFSLSA